MTITIEILRPDDFLHLVIEGHNLRLEKSDPKKPVLVLEDPQKDAFLVAVFPPQSFAEKAFGEVDAPADAMLPPGMPPGSLPPVVVEGVSPPGDLPVRMSGTSRLAFRVPPGNAIPYTIDGLLDWSRLEPSLTSVGEIRGRPFLDQAPFILYPSDVQTAIELPYRLALSPDPDGRWRHSRVPLTRSGRTELWHTRLTWAPEGQRVEELDAERTAPVRAVYSPDYDERKPPVVFVPGEFVTSLDPYDRYAIVRLTSTFPTVGPIGQYQDVGLPAQVRRLTLSSLGGFIDGGGQWLKGPDKFSFSSWKHVAALGRDSYVRTTYRGRLFPLMNRATLIKVTERRFEAHDGSPVAYMRQYFRILVDQREVSYEGQPFQFDGREMPIATIRINVDQTPKVESPTKSGLILWPNPGGVQTSSFEVRLAGDFWRFPCTGTDRGGNKVNFDIGLIFVPADDDSSSHLKAVADYHAAQPKERTVARANQAKVKLADFESASDTTTFVAAGFHFRVDLRGAAGFLPKLLAIDVRVPSIEELTGSPKPVSIAFTPSFLLNGFEPKAGLFAHVVGPDLVLPAKLDVGFSADQAGGIVQPDLAVRGFSREFGPIAGDLAKAATGALDLAGAFASANAKLFGALPIADILGSTVLADAAPKIRNEIQPSPGAPERAVTHMTWLCPTKTTTVGGVTFDPGAGTKINIEVTVTKPLRGPAAPPSTVITGVLNDFAVELMDVVRISMAEFRFRSQTGAATDVAVKLRDVDPIQFKGALKFVQKLSEILPPGIFGANGPRLVLRPESIEVGFTIALPPAAIGVFSIRNIAIGTSLTLPFLTGRPSFAFSFATREKPFAVAVLILGGGGFARVELDTEGVRAVEVMFEFGGMFALDVGVASGSVHILAGIYIGLKGKASELTGYVRVGGEVTVLAIVSVSIEVSLSLSFYPGPPGVAKGVAKLRLSVRIAFISMSVSVSVERSFSGGSRHLSIGESMSAAGWASYASAFA